ncbi:MAG: hypothetical protein K0S36_529 [Nitrosospira multiformis]|nr:hypothetical protein [Nitrosospira multiformis]
MGQFLGVLGIAAPDAGAEPEAGIVGNANGVFLVRRAYHGRHRSE